MEPASNARDAELQEGAGARRPLSPADSPMSAGPTSEGAPQIEARERRERRIRPALSGAAPAGEMGRAIYGEVRDFLRSHERRRRQFPRAVLVGLIAGLVAVAFR
ncbi:MAG: hypothetical protein ACO1SX_24070, partial [Actinomycetota bacterium]